MIDILLFLKSVTCPFLGDWIPHMIDILLFLKREAPFLTSCLYLFKMNVLKMK